MTSITLPAGVTSIEGHSFQDCTSLTALNMPSSLTSIGNQAFYNCSSLTSVSIPSSVTSILGLAFSHCSSLTAIDVNRGNPNYTGIGGVLYNKANKTLIQCPGGRSEAIAIPGSVTFIADGAFYYCTVLSSVNIPESVTAIGEGAFELCTSITSVSIPGTITTIGNAAFASCTSLTSVTMGSGITVIAGGEFSDCTNLTSISFLGLVAPTTVAEGWIYGTPAELRGHAYTASNFDDPGYVWHGLTMGAVLDGGQTYDTAILVLLAVVFVALALVVLWVILRKREGKR